MIIGSREMHGKISSYHLFYPTYSHLQSLLKVLMSAWRLNLAIYKKNLIIFNVQMTDNG